jgi:hypothetical protein
VGNFQQFAEPFEAAEQKLGGRFLTAFHSLGDVVQGQAMQMAELNGGSLVRG